MKSQGTVGGVQSQLSDLDTAFAEYFAITNEKFSKEWNWQYDHESLSKAKTAAIESVRETHEELHTRLDKVCNEYLAAEGADRRSLREYVSSRPALLTALRDHVHWCARHITSSVDRNLLKNGIAALSLQDNRLDFRDNYIALGNLYLAATKAGIHPALDLQKVGLLSETQSRTKWPTDSTQHFLMAFEESAYFKQSVLPKLD